jgi:hypothetical protein
MANIPIIEQSVDEVNFIINYLQTNIAKYDLNALTNNNMGDTPSIVGAHPLALEYGNFISSDDDNYTSILPAIGVELIDDNDNNQKFMGSGHKVYEITQEYIDSVNALTVNNRFENGIVLSDSNLTTVQTEKTNKGSEKLWGISENFLMNQNINISCWSDHWQITRILYVVLRGLLHSLKRELSKNSARNATLTGQGAIYNYEFNQTLFGAEFNLRFINNHNNIEVDSSIGTIKQVDASRFGEEGKSKTKFKGIGE